MPALICIGESGDFRPLCALFAEDVLIFADAGDSLASIGRKGGAVGHLNQAIPIDNDLAPRADETLLESLYRQRHKGHIAGASAGR